MTVLPSDRRRLRRAYHRTCYLVFTESGEFRIRIGEGSPPLDAFLWRHGHDRWIFITAWNPGSRRLDDRSNAARQHRLETELRDRRLRCFPGEGRGDDGAWPPEPSQLVAGVTVAEGLELAVRYGQAAFVCGRGGGTARLRWTPVPGRY